MKKLRRFLASPAITLGALALALGLLSFSAIGGARAALTYYSDNYVSTVQLQEIGVTLLENGSPVATGNATRAARANLEDLPPLLNSLTLLGHTTPEPAGEPFKLGAKYREELAVHNPTDNGADAANGAENITQYVRVTIYRYWVQETPGGWKKTAELDPSLIELNLLTGENGWIEDESSRTEERRVLYYTQPLAPGATTSAFSDTLRVHPDAGVTVTQSSEGGATTATYLYNDAAFQLEVWVDAVQNHNAEDAILSAWGREVSVAENGTLQLR